MFPSGIFVRSDLKTLVSNLPERLVRQAPSRIAVAEQVNLPVPGDGTVLKVREWSNAWCHIDVSGPEDLGSLVLDSLLGREPMDEVLTCHCSHETRDFSYALYRKGVLMETFESRGPSMETVNFMSEIRKVPLQRLLRASDFMTETMTGFGVDPGSEVPDRPGTAVLAVTLPERKKFWKSLLGTVSSKQG